MNRITFLASLYLLAASLPAFAGDAKVGEAVRAAVVKEASKESKSNDSDNLVIKVVDAVMDAAETVQEANAAAPSSRNRGEPNYRADRHFEPTYYPVASCPFGMPGTPTLDELRTRYRDLTDDEMWRLCLNRNSLAHTNRGSCACALLASPNPWRPVSTPHSLARDESTPAEDAEPAEVTSAPTNTIRR